MKSDMQVDTGSTGVKTVKVDFPSNSHKTKEQDIQEKKVQKVTKGNVIQRKKSLGSRFTETFIGEDVGNVHQYLIHDVLVPAAKATLSDMVQSGIEMLLFGEKRSSSSRTTRDRGRSYVSYNNYSGGRDSRDRDRRDQSPQNRARHNFDDIVLESRGEAEEVLSNLVDLTVDYGQASVSDLYDLVGITGSFTDNKYGWRNLSQASVTRARDGYVLNLPKTVLLD